MKIQTFLALLVWAVPPVNLSSAEANRPSSERAMLGRSDSASPSQEDRQAALLNSTIASVQRALKERKSAANVRINGVYDSATREALASYQRKEGLRVTGKADIETLQSLGINPWR
ncbi:MAG: peptidoglycan-binding protein [Deltaproteobacteria bacterium]|nr:peptidoglycan-binding protein [Deltaproteobacteria bacterium]